MGLLGSTAQDKRQREKKDRPIKKKPCFEAVIAFAAESLSIDRAHNRNIIDGFQKNSPAPLSSSFSYK
jgi:hypothetical protein